MRRFQLCSVRTRKRTRCFFSVAAELKSVLTCLFTACQPRNRLFRRVLVPFQVLVVIFS